MFNLTYESLSRTCLNCHQTFKSELGLSAHQSVQVKRGCFPAGLDRKRQKHTFKLEAHKRLEELLSSLPVNICSLSMDLIDETDRDTTSFRCFIASFK